MGQQCSDVYDAELKSIQSRREAAGFSAPEKPGQNRDVGNGANGEQPQQELRGKAENHNDGDDDPRINDLVGLALSGGGVRSAAFNLGVLQSLHRNGLLRFVDYMSMVSGGAYIGAAACNSVAKCFRIDNTYKYARDTFAFAPDDGGQPSPVRSLLKSGNNLIRLDLLASHYLIGLILNLVPRVSLLVAAGAGLAFAWRSLDSDWARDRLAAFGLESDVWPALIPGAGASLVWLLSSLAFLVCQRSLRSKVRFLITLSLFLLFSSFIVAGGSILYDLVQERPINSAAAFLAPFCIFLVFALICTVPLVGTRSRMPVTLLSRIAWSKRCRFWFSAAVVFLLIGLAVLVGNGDITWNDSSGKEVRVTSQWLVQIAMFLLTITGLLPFLRPRKLMRSGEKQRGRILQSWIFYYASAAMLLGLPLMTVCFFGRENISGHAMARGPELDRGDLIDADVLGDWLQKPDKQEDVAGETRFKLKYQLVSSGRVQELRKQAKSVEELRDAATDEPEKCKLAKRVKELNELGDKVQELQKSAANARLSANYLIAARESLLFGKITADCIGCERILKDPDADPTLKAKLASLRKDTSNTWKGGVPWYECARQAYMSDGSSTASNNPYKTFFEASEEAVKRENKLCSAINAILVWPDLFELRSETDPKGGVPTANLIKSVGESRDVPEPGDKREGDPNFSGSLAGSESHAPAPVEEKLATTLNRIADRLDRPAEERPRLPSRFETLLSKRIEIGPEELSVSETKELNRSLLEALLPRVIRSQTQVRRPTVVAHDQWYRAVVFVGATLVFVLSLVFIDPNRTSLHEFYRERLASTYLAEQSEISTTLSKCRPHDAGFAYPLFGSSVRSRFDWIHPSQLDPQFLRCNFTPDFCGSRENPFGDNDMPFVESTSKCLADDSELTLADVLAISGAALTPSYFVHHIMNLLMAVLNFRTGKWLPNPAWTGTRKETGLPKLLRRLPLFKTLSLFPGRHIGGAPPEFIHMTDGGHSDNLGLGALLDRNCRLIIVSDASYDPGLDFRDFARIVEKYRLEDGVEFLEVDGITPLRLSKDIASRGSRSAKRKGARSVLDRNRKEPLNRNGITFARVRYPKSEVRNGGLATRGVSYGLLIYIKPAICGTEPIDVATYSRLNPAFPHDPTGDQSFDEQQFEAYRALGAATGERVCEKVNPSVLWEMREFRVDKVWALLSQKRAEVDSRAEFQIREILRIFENIRDDTDRQPVLSTSALEGLGYLENSAMMCILRHTEDEHEGVSRFAIKILKETYHLAAGSALQICFTDSDNDKDRELAADWLLDAGDSLDSEMCTKLEKVYLTSRRTAILAYAIELMCLVSPLDGKLAGRLVQRAEKHKSPIVKKAVDILRKKLDELDNVA